LHLRYRGVPPKTWLDEYESKLRLIEKREERFEEKEAKLREDAIERGRKKVFKMFQKSFYGEIAKLRYNPYDIKAILHPVDFIVFNGLNDRERLRDIVFLSKHPRNSELHRIRKSIEQVIEREEYDWTVARISLDGKVEFEEE